MKKTIGLLMAVVMCLGIVAPLAVGANEPTTNTNVYFQDFENYTATYTDIARKGSDAAIGAANGWFSDKDTDKNGVYDMAVGKALDGSDNMALNYSNGTDTLQFDFRLTSADHGLVKDLAKDFVMSFKVYPVDIGTFQFTFKDADKTSANTKDFTTSNGAIVMGGKTTGFVIPTKQWSTIEITFHYDETAGGVNKLSAKLNGEAVYYEDNGEKVFMANTNATHPNIDFWRISVTKGKYISIDDWSIDYCNAQDIPNQPADNPGNEGTGHEGTGNEGTGNEGTGNEGTGNEGTTTPDVALPTAPTVTDAEKEDRKYYFHEDFSVTTKDTINTSSKPAAIKAANGFWLCNETNGEFDVKNGYLYMNGAAYVDFQLYQLGDAYTCKESFVWSVKFMPLSEGINGEIIEFVRRDQTGTKWTEKVLKIKDGNITFKDENVGKLELNKWVLIEIAFGYNTAEKAFDKYTVMINGVEIGGGDLSIDDLLLTQIKHFRTFRSMTNYLYALDDFNIVAGTKSVLYAKDYVVPSEPEAPDEPENPGQGGATGSGDTTDTGSNNNNNNNNNTTTEKPETSKPKDTTPKDTANATNGGDEGCGSLISGGAITLLVAVGTGCAVALRKKKED